MTNDLVGHEASGGGTVAGRRSFARLGMGALALGAMQTVPSRPADAAASLSDADVLNFALNLEYLEAEYYLRAVTGVGITGALATGSGGVTAPAKTQVAFQTPAIGAWAARITSDELAHAGFLVRTLGGFQSAGGGAISEPRIDLETSFTNFFIAAGLISSKQTFNPFKNELNFLLGAYIFEDLGVSAYAGAATLLTEPANIAYAASILAIEAEHAGCIRGYLAEIGGGQVTHAIASLRQYLSGVQDNGTDLSRMGGNPFSFVDSDYNGQVFRRTPQQVLNVVYGGLGTGVTSGLFFPSGVNGTVTST